MSVSIPQVSPNSNCPVQYFQLLAEQVDDYAIFLLDAEGIITSWNHGAEKIKCYKAEEAVGRYFGFLYSWQDQELGRPGFHLAQAREHGHYAEEAWRQRKDGSLFWAHVSITALHDSDGSMLGYAKVICDMTEQKQLEDQLRKKQQETEQILSVANAATWKWDSRSDTLTVSENFLQLLGFNGNGSEIGNTLNTWLQFIHPDDRAEAQEAFNDVIQRCPQRALTIEIRLRTADGGYRWFYSRADWQKESQGLPYVLMGVYVDAHEAHMAEEERDRLFKALEEQSRRFRAILENMPAGVIVAEVPSGKPVYRNAKAANLFDGDASPHIQGMEQHFHALGSDKEVLPEEGLPLMRAIEKNEVVKEEEFLYHKANGETVPLSVNAAPIRDEDGVVRLAVSVYHDIRLLKNAQSLLAAEKERAHITLKALTDGVVIIDAHGNIDYLNPAAERLTGWPMEEARHQAVKDILQFSDHDTDISPMAMIARCLRGEQNFRSNNHSTLYPRNGTEHLVDAAIAPIHLQNGQLIGTVVVLHDVTESHTLLQTLAYQATHDALTGLLNRREFESRLRRTLAHAKAGAGSGALLYMDLDQFKIINDTGGHAAGDEMLRQLARTYQSLMRERDTIARLGGDEFALILEHCTIEEAIGVANKILDITTAFKYAHGGKSFRVGVSIGIVQLDQTSVSIEQTLQRADHACYIAKEGGRNRLYVHQEDDADIVRRLNDMHWVGRLNEALRSDQLELFYQPIAPLGDGQLRPHYEILLRLKEPDGSYIGPTTFLPAAERYDLMPSIDRWVLKNVIAWLENEPEHVERLDMCTINLSRRTLADASFQQYAIHCLDESSIPASKLCFEITENGAIENPTRTIQFIETLKTRGYRFALDDFGTGMTSFSYLKLLPVDFIKIDGSFVTRMGENAVDHEMVKFANDISHIMGRQTIAEYVANESTFSSLRDLQVDYAQGYWIGTPQPLQSVTINQ